MFPPQRSACTDTSFPVFVLIVNLILSKSVNSLPLGPVSVWQLENALSGMHSAMFSTVTSKKLTKSANSWIAMFFNMPAKSNHLH